MSEISTPEAKNLNIISELTHHTAMEHNGEHIRLQINKEINSTIKIPLNISTINLLPYIECYMDKNPDEQIVTVNLITTLHNKTQEKINVSEIIAQLYCDKHFKYNDINDDDTQHPLITESDAYQQLISQRQTLDAEDSEFGSYEQQHRLNQEELI